MNVHYTNDIQHFCGLKYPFKMDLLNFGLSVFTEVDNFSFQEIIIGHSKLMVAVRIIA